MIRTGNGYANVFQSTPPGRRRPPSLPAPRPAIKFQSTPPGRRRHLDFQFSGTKMDFNPRLREGGDLLSFVCFIQNIQFQSTPPGRRRPPSLPAPRPAIKFQSTPPGRRRHLDFQFSGTKMDFNPRLREGGDLLSFVCFIQNIQFQSTPPGRRRHGSGAGAEGTNDFNPRLREGGDCNIL